MISFCVLTPQDGLSYDDIRRVWVKAESLGFDSAWLFDHFMPFLWNRKQPYLESWTTLAALAAETERIRVGTLVTCTSYRHPGLLAKMAATLDVVSGGRLEFGIGAGWFRAEYDAYGIPFPTPGVRVRQLDEAITVIKKLWTEPKANFGGKHFTLQEAVCEPKPIQKPHPPILVGGTGGRLLRVAARHASIVNFPWIRAGTFSRKARILEEYCSAVGRRPDDVRKSLTAFCLIGRGGPVGRLLGYVRLGPAIAGSPDQCIRRIEDYVDRGVSHFVLHFPGANKGERLRLFAKEVMPSFKSK